MALNDHFLWGSATASYQCEGAWDLDDKVESNWDRYLHENELENGDVASDFYHHYEEDIRMLSEGGQNAFRFSLSWPRIISDINGTVNQKGLDFYHRVIDTCLRYDVEPFVTLYHWDLPQYLEDEAAEQGKTDEYEKNYGAAVTDMLIQVDCPNLYSIQPQKTEELKYGAGTARRTVKDYSKPVYGASPGDLYPAYLRDRRPDDYYTAWVNKGYRYIEGVTCGTAIISMPRQAGLCPIRTERKHWSVHRQIPGRPGRSSDIRTRKSSITTISPISM